MPPIPIYSQSPIHVSIEEDPAPKTEPPTDHGDEKQPGPTAATTTTQAQPQAGLSSGVISPPEARPGAVPSLPQPTGAVQVINSSLSERQPPKPTPTQNYAAINDGPPPPQPGAVPRPPGAQGQLPATGQPLWQQPLPKHDITGSSSGLSGTTLVPPPPPQMAIPPPTSASYGYPVPRGTSTAQTPSHDWTSYPQPTGLDQRHLDHPPGYVQDAYAAEMNGSQRAALQMAGTGQETEEEGVWDTTKKLVQAAGGRLSAVENEVWKRINKDF